MTQIFRFAALTLAFTTSLAASSPGQIGADECTAADAITGTGAFPFDTAMASDTGTFATSGSEQQCVDLTEDVWIQWSAPAGLDGHIVRFDTCGATFETEIALWQGNCAARTGLGCNEFSPFCPGNGSMLEITVEGGEPYLIQIGFYSFAGFVWGSGNLTITDLGPDPCLTAPPDGLEDNDDCASATVIGSGLFPQLGIARDDGDFYRIHVPAGQRVTAIATAAGLIFQSDFRLFLTDAGCQAQLSVSSSSGPEKIVVASNRTGAGFDVVLEARLSANIAFPLCATYDLEVRVEPETCIALADDGFEGNDVCNDAVPLANGFYPGMHVSDPDVDYYRFYLAGQQLLRLDAFFQEELGNLDMILYRSLWCGTVNHVASAASYADDEHIAYFNQSSETREYILAVFMKNGPGNEFACYDLMVQGALDLPATSYCTATPNSSGESARIEILGSQNVSEQNVFLRSYGMPQGVPGLFYFGPNQIQVAFGDGFRCVGGMTLRVMPAAFAMGPAPAIAQRELNFGAPYATAISAGANLSFQVWFRDPMGGTSGFNLSDGVSATFQ